MTDTKRINGVIGVSVGFDWIQINFENHDITIDKLNVINHPVKNQKAETEKFRLEAKNERELSESIVAEREQLYTTIESQKEEIESLELSKNVEIALHDISRTEHKTQIESQKVEIAELREREYNHYPIVILDLETRIFKLQDDLEAAHDAFEMLPPKDVEIHERTQFKIDKTVDRLLIESLQKQIEGYKAITELAVKELERMLIITSDGSEADRWNGSTGGSGHKKCRSIAIQSISDIKRLSNAQT